MVYCPGIDEISFSNVLSGADEDRIDHRLRRKPRFADKIPESVACDAAVGACEWEMPLEESFLGTQRTKGAEVLQREMRPAIRLSAGAKIVLA